MSKKIFNISLDGAREVYVDETGDPRFVDTNEKVPDSKLKGYMSSVFNPDFRPPIPSPR
jgi:hypothetical protein